MRAVAAWQRGGGALRRSVACAARTLTAASQAGQAQPRGHCAASAVVRVLAPGRRATAALAQLLSSDARPGDVLCLHGDVGAGKSYFCRAFVRALAEDPHLAVPSPTYLLQQAYEAQSGLAVHHFDLYRLSGPEATFNLELAESFASAVSLVEWSERLGHLTPASRLELHLSERSAELSVAGPEHFDGDDEDDGDTAARAFDLRAYGPRWASTCAAVVAYLRATPAEDVQSLGGLRLDSTDSV